MITAHPSPLPLLRKLKILQARLREKRGSQPSGPQILILISKAPTPQALGKATPVSKNQLPKAMTMLPCFSNLFPKTTKTAFQQFQKHAGNVFLALRPPV